MTDKKVFGGVDTHKEFHVAAVVDEVGRIVATEKFTANGRGYAQLLGWLRSHGTVVRIGVEGTGSYGAGLSRHLLAEDVEVVEVTRPNRQARRLRGKNDCVDAEAAACAALNGEAKAVPKQRDGACESIRAIRAIRVAFCSARDARTRIASQIRDLILTAPDALRRQLEPLTADQRAERAARFRPGENLADPAEATKLALRSLGRRYAHLSAELAELRQALDNLTLQANPALRDLKGVGPDVASILLVVAGDNPGRLRSDAALAALCGASPVEASSGRTVRHRLNQGGNRQGNHALWRIAMVRLTSDPRTRAYAARRRAEGKSQREIIRCLKRAIAREVFRALTRRIAPIEFRDLRVRRQAIGASLATVAHALSTWPSRISELELGKGHDADLAARYRTWLNATEQANAA